MIASLSRIWTIGRVTLLEAIRQRVLSVLLLFGLVLVATSSFFSTLLIEEQIKFIKDFGCGAIGLIGFCIALLSTAQLLPQELQNRTVYTILAKPVRRFEFLFGKFLGVVLLVSFAVVLMTLVFAATLEYQGWTGRQATDAQYTAQLPGWRQNLELKQSHDKDISAIEQQVHDPELIKAVLLIWAKLIMTTAIALLISCFATSTVFTIVTTFMLYLVGHLEGTAREVWLARGGESSLWQTALLGLVSILVPDMNSFTIVDEILDGNQIPWAATLHLLSYAGVYTGILLALSEVIFRFREL